MNEPISHVARLLCLAAALWGTQSVLAQGDGADTATPKLTFAFELRAQVGPPQESGQCRPGRRRIVPILGGTVKGPQLNATVLPGGADWQLIQPDGFSE